MKKLFAILATLMLSLSAHAAEFKEGTHYKVLNLEVSKTPTVTEFFSFYCPHCLSFEPIIAQLKEQLPEGAKFQKSHVSFMGGAMKQSMSKAYATMVALDVESKMIPVMFAYIHEKNNAPRNDKELRQIFLDQGIDGEKFDAAFDSFAIDSMVNRFDKQFKDSGLASVPAIVVNNNYLVDTSNISTTDEFIKLVNHLLTKTK